MECSRPQSCNPFSSLSAQMLHHLFPGCKCHLYFREPQIHRSYPVFTLKFQTSLYLPTWPNCWFPTPPQVESFRLLYIYHLNTYSGENGIIIPLLPSPVLPHHTSHRHHFLKLPTALHFLLFNPKASDHLSLEVLSHFHPVFQLPGSPNNPLCAEMPKWSISLIYIFTNYVIFLLKILQGAPLFLE